ncbi:hypothetical protein BASA83_013151 [Batrachochytrium salamandrivorans]|nr:hypothetical protein BASA83_013151 [Batrachochytrium salamandrivorans]
MQKNQNSKDSHGKGKPAPSGAFTHRIREDGEVFSSEEGRETSSDTTPLASVAGSVRMRSTDSDRSVRATPKKARDASPPPQDDLWVVVKNLSQQVAAQQAEMDALRNTIALQQKATANLEKILGNMASQAASTSEATQTALAAILARLEAGPVVLQVVVPNNKDYPPLPPTGATSKRKTVATKPNPATTTATTTTTTTTSQPSKDTRFADAVKRRPTHQQLVERQPEFRKAGAAAWLALKRETSVPAHSAPKVELSSGLQLIYASGFSYAKPGDLRKAMQGARIRTSAVRDIRWISRQVVQLLVDADYVSAFTRIITSLDATIVKSFKAWIPRSEAAEKDKLAAISSFAVKTVTTIQRSPDVKARNFFRSLLASIGGKTLEAATVEATKIRVQTPARQRNIIQRLEHQSKQTHWRIRQNYRHRRPDQPRPTAPPPPLSRQILAFNVANISNKRPAIRHIVRNTRLWAISETCITSSKFRFTVPGFDVIQHPATGPGRRGIALGIPSCFGGHEHGSAVGTMILAKVPNFTPECLWIVGSVYVGHSGATTNYSRREAFASIRQALDRVVPFDNNHLVLIFGDWNTDPQRLQRIVHSWGHGLTVMQFLWITDHQTQHSPWSTSFVNRPLFQCNTLRDEWSRLKAAATQLERVDGRKQWVKHADNLDRAVSDGRTDLVFSAARAMSGNSSRSAAVTPLYNSNGIVQYDPTSIPACHASDILDQDFSWNQIAAALLQMSPRKAPGDDGITTAFYQAALYMPANTQEGVPTNPICSCSVESMWSRYSLQQQSLVHGFVHPSFSIDKKDGDPLNPGDKRGIALINVGLKLVCKVLQMRIERFVETNNLLSYEQAGFRKRERKLQNMGFPRRTLAFLKALYTSSSARARAESLLSDPFPIQRGVRQGCPLSGLLVQSVHQRHSRWCRTHHSPWTIRETPNPIRGLMYADDVAVFADSEQSLLAASTAIEQWANQCLANHQLTVNYRSRIFSAVVMGKAYYGLELVGGNKSHLAPLQTTINKGIRLFTGARLSTAI